jgi:hypothetical protein
VFHVDAISELREMGLYLGERRDVADGSES